MLEDFWHHAERLRVFSLLFLKSMVPSVVGLLSAFEVRVSLLMQEHDMEHQVSLPRRISAVD